MHMEPEKSIVQTLQELRDDLKQFIETRYAMLRAEVGASLVKLRAAAVLIGAAAVLALVGLILLGACVALWIALAFGAFTNQVGLIWGFLATGGGALLLAALVGAAGKSKMTAEELVPNRTLRVLQRDQEVLKEGGQDERFRRRA